jgi:hypothetical protein
MTRSWIFATLLVTVVACASGERDNGIGSPGVGIAAVDPTDSGSGAESGHGGGAGDGGVDPREE